MATIFYPADPCVRAAPPVPAAAILATRLNTAATALRKALASAFEAGHTTAHPAGGVRLTAAGADLLTKAHARRGAFNGASAWIVGAQDGEHTAAEQGAFVVGRPDGQDWRIHPSVFQFPVPKRHHPLPALDISPLLAQMDGLDVALIRTPAMRAGTIWPSWAATHTQVYRDAAIAATWARWSTHLWDGLVACLPPAPPGATVSLDACAQIQPSGAITWAAWRLHLSHTQSLHTLATTPCLAPLWAHIQTALDSRLPALGPVQAIPAFWKGAGSRRLWDGQPLPSSAHARLQAKTAWEAARHPPVAHLLGLSSSPM